jgi:hypothetical protein
MAISINTFEPYNTTLVAGEEITFEVVSQTIESTVLANTIYEKFAVADMFYISVTGTAGKTVGLRVDCDTGEYFNIPATQTVKMTVPVAKKVALKNTSDAQLGISIVFVRGRNKS